MKNYPSRFDWQKAVDETTRIALGKCYPRNWKDEDHLTRCMLSALRDDHSFVTIGKDNEIGKNTKCQWDVYKNTKEMGMEQKYGDIGVLVQLIFDSSKILEGVAFLEAKRIYHHPTDDSKSNFGALDRDQLERYSNNSPFHRTVFYDCQNRDAGYEAAAFTLPTKHLLAIEKDNREIYPYCEHFSYCLTNRYFQGYELDFNEKSVDAVKGFLDSNGGVHYLIVAKATLNPDVELNPEPVAINNQIYSQLNLDEPDNRQTNSFNGPTM